MKKLKMSLANIQGMLSRAEMKNIMAGSGDDYCTEPGECMPKNIVCNGVSYPATAACVNNKCYWSVVC